MLKEFYDNLEFDETEPIASLMVKGRKIALIPDFVADIIGCQYEGVERYFSHKETPYEGYIRDRAIRELMEGRSVAMSVSKI